MKGNSDRKTQKKDGAKVRKPPPDAIPIPDPDPPKPKPKTEKRLAALEDAVTAIRVDMDKALAEMDGWRQEIADLRDIVNRNTFHIQLLQNIISHHHGERAET